MLHTTGRTADVADAVQLRLFVEPDENGGPSHEAPDTLDAFWRLVARPEMSIDLLPGTIADYSATVATWRRLVGDPPFPCIDDRTILDFRQRVAKLAGRKGATLSRQTIEKHERNLRSLLAWAAEEDRCEFPQALARSHRRRGRRKREAVESPKPFSTQEIQALRTVCGSKRRPKLPRVHPSTWWDTLILAAYWTGLRRETLASIRWEWIEGHVLTIPAAAMKGGQPSQKWLADDCMVALNRLRPSGLPLAFAWTDSAGELISINDARVRITKGFAKLAYRAGLKTQGDFRGLHCLRASHGTETFGACGVEMASNALDHSDQNTTVRHYVGAEAQVAAKLQAHRDAVERLPRLGS